MKTKKTITAALTFLFVMPVTFSFAQLQEGENVNSNRCIPQATGWFLGGNNIVPPLNPPTPPSPATQAQIAAWLLANTPQTDAGTCNNYPFILKANGFRSVFITPAGNIGINNASPAAALDVRSPSSALTSGFKIYGDALGNIESGTDIRMHFASGSNFMFNEGTPASNTPRMIINNGNVGIGTTNPTSKLEVRDQGPVAVNVYATSANDAKLWVKNSIFSYNLGIDNGGIGHIGANINQPSQTDVINFRTNPNNAALPQVWIGSNIPTNGPDTDFKFAVDGKVLAQTIHVSDATSPEIIVTSTSANNPQIAVENTMGSYGFNMDNTGTGHISSGTNIINFKNTSSVPQVWIGSNVPTSGPHNNFNFGVDGKIFGRSVIIQANTLDALDVIDATNTSQFRVKASGYVYARDITVTMNAYPDYVFNNDYKLMPLQTLEKYIQANHHLPNVPSASEFEKNGAALGEQNKIQMEKIEELTLYIIALEKRLNNLENK